MCGVAMVGRVYGEGWRGECGGVWGICLGWEL